MLSLAFKYIFIICALLYIAMTIYGKLFVFRKKKPQFVSDYCATMAGVIGVYIFSSLCLAYLLPCLTAKIIILLFGFSPFIFGLVATYHTEKYYTTLQTIVLFLSILYIVI